MKLDLPQSGSSDAKRASYARATVSEYESEAMRDENSRSES
jgi:hypothetical protein